MTANSTHIDLFRWRNTKLVGQPLSVAPGQVVHFDAEGFPVDSQGQPARLPEVFAAKLAIMPPKAGWERVAINSDALWNERFAKAEKVARDARDHRAKCERDLIGANNFVREADRQYESLVAEKARADALSSGEVDPASIAAP